MAPHQLRIQILDLPFPLGVKPVGRSPDGFSYQQALVWTLKPIRGALIVFDLRKERVGGMGLVSLPFLPRGSCVNMSSSSQAWPRDMTRPPAWKGSPQNDISGGSDHRKPFSLY